MGIYLWSMLFTECKTKMTIIDKIIEIIDKPQAARLLCPYSGLVFLAMVLIYKDVSGINLRQETVIKLLKAAASELKATKLKSKLKVAVLPQNSPKRSATLLDLYAEHAAEYNFKTSRFATESDEPVMEPVPELLKSLIDKGNANHVGLVKGNALSHAIEEFLKAMMKACGIFVKDIKDLIENAKRQQASFVIPDELSLQA